MDRTNGRFGKFRPYMLVGNIIIWCSLIVIFNTPSGWGISRKYMFTTVFYIIYIIGYYLSDRCYQGRPGCAYQ